MLYYDQSDETLVMLTLAGEQRAYEVLVVRYERTAIAAANSVVHNPNIAEDAAQDAFITAWMKLDTLRDAKKYGAWISRIAKNCAKNLAMRFHSYLSLDTLENCISDSFALYGSPEESSISSEERKELHESISGLPEKVKKVIHLYYFEGLSIAEIADRMSITAGTVKRQLYDGRKQLRKELSAMNEDINDTLVQRVMKKVEELKLWKLKNNKTGFEKVYKEVLAEVEELNESEKKYHALADVLMCGWWWLPGVKNDAMMAKIADAAMQGKNEEVMSFIVSYEDDKYWHAAQEITLIRDKQIPKLEEGGFKEALGREWIRLGENYFKDGQRENGFNAIEKALTFFKPSDPYYTQAKSIIEFEQKYDKEMSDEEISKCYFSTGHYELKYYDGELLRWNDSWYTKGEMYTSGILFYANHVFLQASTCDRRFTKDGLNPGQSYCGSDGTTLTFESDCETVDLDCGRFIGCELWVSRKYQETIKTWYKSGVGIVKQQATGGGVTQTRTLKSYKIVGGSGLIPLAKGNEWEYTSDISPEVMLQSAKFRVTYTGEKNAVISFLSQLQRYKYDENSWSDMLLQVKSEYFTTNANGIGGKVHDITYPADRAVALAKTPLEKAHAKAASSVAKRIMETSREFNPNLTAEGIWNFFNRRSVFSEGEKIVMYDDRAWSFELKYGDYGVTGEPILYNNVLEILQDNTGSIWSDEWRPGAKISMEHEQINTPISTKLECAEEKSVTTKAGTFSNCLKLSIDTSGYDQGLWYIGGKKEYYFAWGVGVVKTVNHYNKDTCTAVYELTAYEGTGEGYMPLINGATRRYEAMNMTDGFVGSADYVFVEDDNGQLTLIEDRLGVRKILDDITQYSSILGEQIEQSLLDQGKMDEYRAKHGINNINILIHYLSRPLDCSYDANKLSKIHRYKLRFIENLCGGKIIGGWLGVSAWISFKASVTLFGSGQKDVGYEYLEKSLDLYTQWQKIPEGEPMELGEEFVFCGVKLLKGSSIVLLPNGEKGFINDQYYLDEKVDYAYHGLTASKGWEWFDSVRNEQRYKDMVESFKKLIN